MSDDETKPRTEPIRIEPDAVYTLDAASNATSISTKALSSAINSGELKANRRARRFFVSGSELRAWLIGCCDEASKTKAISKTKRQPKTAKQS